MTDKPPKDEPGADERFERCIANALKMPPKPHKPKKEAAPKDGLAKNQTKDGKSGGK